MSHGDEMESGIPMLLAILVSMRLDTSTSRKLTNVFTGEWQAHHPGGRIVVRDLARNPLPYVDLPWIGGAFAPPGTITPAGKAAIKLSDELVAELQEADHLVIGTPMYNLSIPAALKAWIDHIVRVGVTLGAGNVGLLTGKKATVILATGGDFSPGSPIEGYNHASNYMRAVLAWVGITDVEIVMASRARAGIHGEHAVAEFGPAVGASARRG